MLSVEEIRSHYTYNNWSEEVMCGHCMKLMIAATEYAKQQGVYTYQITQDFYDGDSSWGGLRGERYSTSCIGFTGAVWWLRSPGDGYAVDVRDTGYCGWNTDYNTIYDEEGIRPALYIEQ